MFYTGSEGVLKDIKPKLDGRVNSASEQNLNKYKKNYNFLGGIYSISS